MRNEHLALPVECTGSADDLWRIDLTQVNGSRGYVDNVERGMAEEFLRCWIDRDPGAISFCRICPVGRQCCTCSDGNVFYFTEFASVRIMPMREAIG